MLNELSYLEEKEVQILLFFSFLSLLSIKNAISCT